MTVWLDTMGFRGRDAMLPTLMMEIMLGIFDSERFCDGFALYSIPLARRFSPSRRRRIGQRVFLAISASRNEICFTRTFLAHAF